MTLQNKLIISKKCIFYIIQQAGAQTQQGLNAVYNSKLEDDLHWILQIQ